MSVARIMDKDHNTEVIFRKDHAIVRNLRGNIKMFAEHRGNLFFIPVSNQEANAAIEQQKGQNWIVAQTLWSFKFPRFTRNEKKSRRHRHRLPGSDGFRLRYMSRCKIASSAIYQKVFLCGPMRTTSNGGARYFMTITDDYSCWGDIYFLRSKDEALLKLIEFIEKAERQTGLKVKAVQSDNGTEFCNRALDSYFKRKGILHRLTTPHTPQQNGVAKRRNRTLVDSARCILMQADLLNSF